MTEEITVRLSVEEAEALRRPHSATTKRHPERLASAKAKLRAALASQPEHSEEAGNCPTCGSDDPRVVDGVNSRGRPARFVWTDASVLSDKRRAHWHCPDPFHQSPSPEPGSDAEVARRLEAFAGDIAGGMEADVLGPDDAELLRLAADRLLARPVLSDDDQARLELIRDHEGNDLSEKDKALLTRLAAKSDQENRGEGS